MELQSATLALTMLLATGLTIRAFTPPNPNPKAVPLNAGAGVDNMRVFTSGVFLLLYVAFPWLLFLASGTIAITFSNSPDI